MHSPLFLNKLSPKAAFALLITGVLFASISSILIRFSASPAIIIAFYRMLFAALLTVPLILAQERLLRQNKNRAPAEETLLRSQGVEGNSRVNVQTAGWSVLSGVFLAGHFAFWITSLKHTTIASSVVLVSTHPLFVALGAYVVLQEKLTFLKYVSLFFVLAGTVLLSYGDISLGSSALYGNGLALLGSVCMAGYLIIGRYVRQTLDTVYYTGTVYGVSGIVLFGAALIMGVSLFPYSLREFTIFFSLAFFCTILGHTLYNVAVKYISSFLVSVSILIEPIAATILGVIIFSEIPPSASLFGGAAILTGVYFSFVGSIGRPGDSFTKQDRIRRP